MYITLTYELFMCTLLSQNALYLNQSLSDRTTPYHIVASNPAKFKSEEAPCILANDLFNLAISFECGGAS